VDPRNSFNYGNDIAIVLGTGSQNGQARRFTVSTCAHAVNNAWPAPLLTPDRVYVHYRQGTERRVRSIRLDTGAEEWVKPIGTGSDFSSFNAIVKGEETRIYVGTRAGVSMLKNI
jgi:hypothetical protein